MIGKELISEELLGSVLDCNAKINGIMHDGRTIFFTSSDHNKCVWPGANSFDINIYELASKVKEWALKNKYSLSSELFRDNEGVCHIYRKLGLKTYINSVASNTEPEAIFIAGQWILGNKEQS